MSTEDLGRARPILAVFLLTALLAGVPRTAGARDYYYVLIFASQGQPRVPKYTHTWATFVHATGEGEDPSGYMLEAHTISWFPATLDVRVWRLRPEPGVNLDLEATLRLAYANRELVTLWGPLITTPVIYERSLQVHQTIVSGEVLYRAIDRSRDYRITDCIHAVTAVDPIFGREHYPLIRVGPSASRFIAREIVIRGDASGGVDQAQFDNSWLIPRLGLDRHPIEVIPPQRIPKRSCLFCRVPE